MADPFVLCAYLPFTPVGSHKPLLHSVIERFASMQYDDGTYIITEMGKEYFIQETEQDIKAMLDVIRLRGAVDGAAN